MHITNNLLLSGVDHMPLICCIDFNLDNLVSLAERLSCKKLQIYLIITSTVFMDITQSPNHAYVHYTLLQHINDQHDNCII